jgi:acetyl esterase/lipase
VVAGSVPGLWITPRHLASADAQDVILYIHGGGFYSGSSESHKQLAAVLATFSQSNILVIDYRLMPEYRFPDQTVDSEAAYDWLRLKGYTAKRIAIAGESVGENLSLELVLHLRDEKQVMPAAIVMMSPVTDLAATGQSMKDNATLDPVIQEAGILAVSKSYLSGDSPTDPSVSPIYADLRGLPPMLIQVGSRETLVDDAVRLARRAGEDNVSVTLQIWPGMIHQWQLFPTIIPDARKSLGIGGHFIHQSFVDARN